MQEAYAGHMPNLVAMDAPELDTMPEVRARPGASALDRARAAGLSEAELKAETRNLSFFYGDVQALKSVNLPVAERRVTALIGPSGCGKSTLLRCFNRMHDLYKGNHYEGELLLHPGATNIVGSDADPLMVRLKVGMVFQRPNPFPKSIYENIAAGLRIRGVRSRTLIDEIVEVSLRRAGLWDEVKDRLHGMAYALSGGQQQRLCIARALAPNPDILLLDEPTSALDPMATDRIEELIRQLKDSIAVLIVTHNMQQASRVADFTAFMHLGDLLEYGRTNDVFMRPQMRETQGYITGRFG